MFIFIFRTKNSKNLIATVINLNGQAMRQFCIKTLQLALVVFIFEMCSGQLPLVINTWPLPDATSAGII